MHHTNASASRSKAEAISPTEAVVVLIVLSLLALAVVLSSPHPEHRIGSTTVRVNAGDTLWSIANDHPVPGMSTSEVSSLVASMNDMTRATIHPGDTLRVPVPLQEGDSYAMR